MDKRFIPDLYVEKYTCITPKILLDMGIHGLLTDLDQTLIDHGEKTPSNELLLWLQNMKSSGIRLCILSNNSSSRTYPFAKSVDLPYISRCFKPHISAARNAFGILNMDPNETAVLGDQIFTDLKLAVKLGVKCILTEPLGKKTTPYVRYKRIKEKKYKKLYKKEDVI